MVFYIKNDIIIACVLLTGHIMTLTAAQQTLAYLKQGGDPDSLVNGDTLLINAIKANNTIVVKELLEQGANPNLTGLNNKNPLYWAIFFEHNNALRLLIIWRVNMDNIEQTVNQALSDKGCYNEQESKRIISKLKWFANEENTYGDQTGIIAKTEQNILIRETQKGKHEKIVKKI